MFHRHQWKTISVEEKLSPMDRMIAGGLKSIRHYPPVFAFRTKIVHQECTKCGIARLESVEF